jgi:hypothetical protein
MDFIAITICVNYSDFLSSALPINRPFFHDYYIVTVTSDTKTIELAKEHNCKLIFGDDLIHIYNERHGRNAIFNKSGLCCMAQKQVHQDHPTAWICLMDADVIIGNAILELDLGYLDISALYGLHRLLYETPYDYLNNIAKKAHGDYSENPLGYFQMYFDKSKYYREWSVDCQMCDVFFHDLFPNRKVLKSPICYHLGFRQLNWQGRITEQWTIPSTSTASNPHGEHSDSSNRSCESH